MFCLDSIPQSPGYSQVFRAQLPGNSQVTQPTIKGDARPLLAYLLFSLGSYHPVPPLSPFFSPLSTWSWPALTPLSFLSLFTSLSLFLFLLLYNKALKPWAASSYQNPPCKSNGTSLSISSCQTGPQTLLPSQASSTGTQSHAGTAPPSGQGPPPC